jgi:hypothetical protein
VTPPALVKWHQLTGAQIAPNLSPSRRVNSRQPDDRSGGKLTKRHLHKGSAGGIGLASLRAGRSQPDAWPVKPILVSRNFHEQFGVAVFVADRVSGQEYFVDACGPAWASTLKVIASERLAKPPLQDGRIDFPDTLHLRLFSPVLSKHQRERESNRRRFAFLACRSYAGYMIDEAFPLPLTPTERVTLEMIRDLHHAPPARVDWATEKGYAKAAGKGRQLELTDAGVKALADDYAARLAARGAQRPRRR